MRDKTLTVLLSALLLFAVSGVLPVAADELTQRIQQDLVALGYEPGKVDGEMTTDTTVAIAKFQAEHDMPVTGEVSPLLAGIMSAEVDKQAAGKAADTAAPAAQRDPAELRAAQQACLQEKMEKAQAANKKKRGLGRLLSAVSRTASQTGNYDVARTAGDAYSAHATAADLSAAAKDLGLTDDDMAECQNPP
jgi:peptidoglycan hydrolase-like protein with peptidoglycan-binding domain